MKKPSLPVAASIACIPIGIILALIAIQTNASFLAIAGNVLTYGGILSLVIIWIRKPKSVEQSPATTSKREFAGYAIFGISVVSLPFAVYLAVFHPKGTHVPPSLITLPLGMLGVGLDRAFPGQIWRRLLRWSSVVLFIIGSIATAALWYIQSQSSTRGFQIGNDAGQYAPQNFFFFVFAALLFLYSSPSEKVRQRSSPFVWFGLVLVLFFLCIFIGLGVSAMLGNG